MDFSFTQVGVSALILLSGVMAIVFVSYVKRIIDKIDSVEHITPLIKRVETLVDKVERMFTTLEVMKQTTSLELDSLKERVRRLEEKLSKKED